MTGSDGKIRVPVEWAWQGKEPGDRGYRLLACSTGDLSAGNFGDILDRFVPGTLDRLPQITVSFVPVKNSSGYLSMAFHEEAGGLDRLGRDVTFTRFFCMPYENLAAGPVSYRAICQAFERTLLPDTPGAPFEAELSCPPATIPGDTARALPVVELLLTGNPVCIVEAEATTMTERLAYIDTVMSLLPYGMRAEMAAATWTSSTYRKHKYRLFFSEAPRRAVESGVDDHLVRWRPDRMVIEPAPKTLIPAGLGGEYREWLQHVLEGPSITTELARDGAARAFRTDDITKLVEDIPEKEQKRFWSRTQKRREAATKEIAIRETGTRREATRVVAAGPEPWPGRGAPQDPIEHALDKIARHIDDFVRGTLDALPGQQELQEALSRARPNNESRRRYRERIVRGRLLRDSLPLAQDKKVGFYKVILRAAYGEAISYLDYCEVEKMIYGRVPEKPLLQAIDERLGAELHVDKKALFIVRCNLLKGKYQKVEFGLISLLEIAAHQELREDHAKIVWEAVVYAVKNVRSADVRRSILSLLHKRGFLAHELQQRAPVDLNFQVEALRSLLEAVYKGGVTLDAFPDVLTGARGNYPTLALFLVLYEFTADEDIDDMYVNFMRSLGESAKVPSSTRARLAHFGFARDLDDGYEETDGDPPEGESALIEGISSTTGAVRFANTLLPADQPKPKRGRFRRTLNPSGEFTVHEQKSRADNDR